MTTGTFNSKLRLLCAALCLISIGTQSLAKAPSPGSPPAASSTFNDQKNINFDELEKVVLAELEATNTPGEGELIFVPDAEGKVQYLYTDLHAARRVRALKN